MNVTRIAVVVNEQGNASVRVGRHPCRGAPVLARLGYPAVNVVAANRSLRDESLTRLRDIHDILLVDAINRRSPEHDSYLTGANALTRRWSRRCKCGHAVQRVGC